jgi:hypothetical protein
MKTVVPVLLAAAARLVVAQDDCHVENSANLLVNPSWEEGRNGWQIIYPTTISTTDFSDGAQSL